MPELATALGGLLGYGAIGLGLALAIVAAVILNKGELTPARAKATSQFMIFALALVTIGAALEFYKAYAANQAAQQAAFAARLLLGRFRVCKDSAVVWCRATDRRRVER
jgi:CBS domain containing-hemolysin-like protein